MKTVLRRWFADDRGATAIEYGLIAALIGVGIILALTAMNQGLTATFATLSALFAAAIA